MKNRKSTWRVACETCRKEKELYHCTWRFQSEKGARAKIKAIRETEDERYSIYTPVHYRCPNNTHDLRLDHWDGERWVKQA